MPSNKKLLQAAAGNAGESLYVEDVFSTYLYTGTGSAMTITNGIDLDGEGGLVWIKNRDTVDDNVMFSPTFGPSKMQRIKTDAQETVGTDVFQSFNSDGFTHGGWGGVGGNGNDIASWTFRKAEKFFDVVNGLTSDSSGNLPQFNHNLGSTPGCVFLKATNSGSNWVVFHKGLSASGANQYIQLNNTNAATNATGFGVATDTTFQVGAGSALVPDKTYVAYLFASDAGGFGDDGSENIIKCGSYTGTSSLNSIACGFEPQFVLVKCSSHANTRWSMFDAMRGVVTGASATTGDDQRLAANSSDAETAFPMINFTATGFDVQNQYSDVNENSRTYIYIAIRRPMKTPESGTEVFAPKTRSGSGAIVTTGVGFTPDVFYNFDRTYGGSNGLFDRLRGRGILQTMFTSAENATSPAIYDLVGFDTMDGVELGGAYNINMTSSGRNFVDYYFKRATGFMDVVAYTGDGASSHALTHNLGVSPELIITKRRDASGDWRTATNFSASAYSLYKVNEVDPATNINYAAYGMYAAKPTSTTFTVGSGANVNASGGTFVSYLFGTVAGVSKVGSVVHSGTTNVDCGFSAGARFVLAKRADQNSGWFIWDSVRGIVAGNDPYMLLNSAAAEVTNTDYIDPLSSGFTLTSSFTSGTYIFLAIA